MLVVVMVLSWGLGTSMSTFYNRMSRGYMQINTSKAKVMITAIEIMNADISFERKPIEQIHKFSYLCKIITEDDISGTEIKSRIGRAKRVERLS